MQIELTTLVINQYTIVPHDHRLWAETASKELSPSKKKTKKSIMLY